MARLFLSLYFAICLGLVVINISSNLLFEHLQSDSDINNQLDIQQIAQIAQGYAVLDHVQLQNVIDSLPYRSQLIAYQQLSLLPEQERLLTQGQVLTLFESSDQVSIFVPMQANNAENSDPQLLHISGVKLSNSATSDSLLEQSVILLSYLSLGLFVLAWSRPLWRDLATLKQASEQIQQGDFELKTSIGRHSVIFPVVKSFKVMASKIAELISNQKQMTHAVSHDIRTPLARIKFSLAILKSQPELIEKTSNDMLEDVAEIDHLTSELLTFAQLETEQNLRIENVNINQLVENLADKLRRNSNVDLDIVCEKDYVFQCDGHLIERCLQNLITNGFKYASNKVEVRIFQSPLNKHNQDNEPKKLWIEVHDDGKGIAEEHRERVLKAFSRVDDSRNKNSGGFGLGLAIVSKIVAWHNGKVEVAESKLGGALFRIQL